MTKSEYSLLLRRIQDVASKRGSAIIAIDGRCGSGKTTLAEQLKKDLNCNVFHMDDFFLRPEQQTPARLSCPGENIDHERFLSEILLPLQDLQPFSYQPYRCKEFKLGTPVQVSVNQINVIEGAYACHSALWRYYDLRIFLSVTPEEQMQRINRRNRPKTAARFFEQWIPLEESYFKSFNIASRCDLRLHG